MIPEISPLVLINADQSRDAFLTARPFKHVLIDEFFNSSFAEALLREFPVFDSRHAIAESGKTGGKAVQTEISRISPTYQRLYELISSRDFLDFVAQLSGIPDLLADPLMFGGGTHENLHGQELDPHVDFNYDQSRRLHRRLNLIVYLNPEWDASWGGGLELHSNPQTPFENQIQTFDPLFNRCVMFETNEYSWHGFPRIQLPEQRRHLSRKSLSIYLYTQDRPAGETAPEHGTFYVQRPLPPHIKENYTLTAADISELQRLLLRRDRWIQFYQEMELKKNGELSDLTACIQSFSQRVPIPLTGYVLTDGAPQGVHDEWVSSYVSIKLRPLMPVTGLVLRGYRPGFAPPVMLSISINAQPAVVQPISESFEVSILNTGNKDDILNLEIRCDGPRDWAAATGDDRDLAFVLTELRALHPGIPASSSIKR